MSRIQDILSKAERDGTARRTRSLTEPDYTPRPADDSVHARGFVETGPSGRAFAANAALAPAIAEPRVFTPIAPEAMPPVARSAPSRVEAPPALAPVEQAPPVLEQAHPTLDRRLVAALAPTSLPAEQYRSLRTRLKRAESGRSLRAIAITSPAKGDGKSLTAANLALTMAQEFNQRVLLLDADLRRPSVHQLFGLRETPGLGDVLMNGADLDQALVTLPDHHLTVLTAGHPPSHPAELLGSATMRRLLDTLRTRFDRILIDVPPVAPLADLHILAPMIDGLLMIVRAGITQKPAIERALAGLDRSKVLGLVLNESGSEGTDAYNYEGYGYLAG